MIVIKLNYKIIATVFTTLIISIFVINYSVAHTTSSKDGIKLPIIMYHQVKKNNLGKDIISLDDFEEDLKYLKENNYTTITMTDLIDYVYDDKELPENPIILTFDDGYLNNYEYVFPLLKKYDAKIVMSIIGKGSEDFSKKKDANLNHFHVTWDQIKEMSDSGYVEMQNHTFN